MRQRSAVRRLSHVIAAALVAGAATEVYRSFLFLHFNPIRAALINSDHYSLHHVVTAALPDLSPFHDHAAILSLELDNPLAQQIRIALSIEGRLVERFTVPGDRSVSRDVVVSPEVVGTLADRRGEEPPIELTGDADGWVVTGLAIRNHHARLGSAPLAVVVPAAEQGFGSPASTLLAIAVTFFILSYLLISGHRTQGSIRRIGHAIGILVCLVYLTCLILPRISSYKLLLSHPTFWVLGAGLFLPALLKAAAELLRIGPSRRVAAAQWTRHETTFQRGTALLGLTAIAVAQPVFGVVSNSPEFFAARGTTASTALSAVIAISIGLPLGLLALERVIRSVNRPAAAIVFGMVIATLGAAAAMPWIVRHQVAASRAVTLGALTGTLLLVGYARSRVIRLFLTALAPAALIVPALFVLDSGVRQSFVHGQAVPVVQTLQRKPPIVFVIFDELPLNSLLAADGDIDAGRYPNFAALARGAYWFRNATTVSYSTSYAVPAILSGRYPTTSGAVPTLQYYPVNLFTTLAGHYDISADLTFKLCPQRVCLAGAASHDDTVGLLLSDLGLVWLHIVLPPALRDALPPVTDDWADFGGFYQAAHPNGRGGVFAQFISMIDGRSGRLHFIHSMLPHTVFEYVPSGRRYRAMNRQAYQRHLAQVGFVDHLIGDLISHLRRVGAYDNALLIVTSDHGVSYLDGEPRRLPQKHNLTDILQVPLFVKLPGQGHGEIVDRFVETIDILPTVLDVVGASPPLHLDGTSLLHSRVQAHISHTYIQRNRPNAEARVVEDLSADQTESLRRKEHRFGTGNLMGLYAPPGARDLLGTSGEAPAMPALSEVKVRIRDLKQYSDVRLDRDRLPLYVRGIIRTPRRPPLSVAVVVNGIVAAVTESYLERGRHVFSTLIPEEVLREGQNKVSAAVINTGARTSTH